MKITAVSMFMIVAWIAASAGVSASPSQASGGAIAPLNLTTPQTETNLRSSCATWRQFTSSFGSKTAQSKFEKQPGGAQPNC